MNSAFVTFHDSGTNPICITVAILIHYGRNITFIDVHSSFEILVLPSPASFGACNNKVKETILTGIRCLNIPTRSLEWGINIKAVRRKRQHTSQFLCLSSGFTGYSKQHLCNDTIDRPKERMLW